MPLSTRETPSNCRKGQTVQMFFSQYQKKKQKTNNKKEIEMPGPKKMFLYAELLNQTEGKIVIALLALCQFLLVLLT